MPIVPDNTAVVQQSLPLFAILCEQKGNQMMKDSLPMAVSIPRAAELLGVGRSSIYKLVNAGRLPRLKIGKRALVPVGALNDFMAELSREAA
jgi:excisionase family DNA binding protein